MQVWLVIELSWYVGQENADRNLRKCLSSEIDLSRRSQPAITYVYFHLFSCLSTLGDD